MYNYISGHIIANYRGLISDLILNPLHCRRDYERYNDKNN